MIRTCHLGSYSSHDSGELARRVEGELGSRGIFPASLLFRGFGCNPLKLQRVQITGTDRRAEELESKALDLMEDFPGKFTLAQAKDARSHLYVNLSSARELPLVAECAFTDMGVQEYPMGAIAAYHSSLVRPLPPTLYSSQAYEFVVDAQSALDSIFTFARKKA